MSIDAHWMVISGIRIDVVRKPIKNLHLGVYPPNGRVRVAAPIAVTDDAVRLAVVSRLPWINRQRAKFEAQARQSERNYVTGESHYFLGRRYRLNVIEGAGRARVQVRNGAFLDLVVRHGAGQPARKQVFQRWLRQELRLRAAPLIEKWAKSMEVSHPLWGIKQMKTKWGSCNSAAGRIWLNLELIKKPPQCLEYAIVHELTHLCVRNHDEHFVAMMNSLLPQWRLIRDELNAEPLAHEEW